MTSYPIYQVDAFATQPFAGNPAAVVMLETWLPDAMLQAIAAENNLSETAFIVPSLGDNETAYGLRWFTPTVEVDLCGHATLAAAYVLRHCRGVADETITFSSRSGPLAVRCEGDALTLDFPANPPKPVDALDRFADALGATPNEVLVAGGFGVAVFDHEDNVAELSPNMAKVAAQTSTIGVIATARGRHVDFVSRFFAPQSGVSEDPVTGSAHTVLAPYWAERLGKQSLTARQISARGGDLICTPVGERVHIGGHGTLYLEGSIHVATTG